MGGFAIPLGSRTLLISSDRGLRNSSSSLRTSEREYPLRWLRRSRGGLRGHFFPRALSITIGEGRLSPGVVRSRFFQAFFAPVLGRNFVAVGKGFLNPVVL